MRSNFLIKNMGFNKIAIFIVLILIAYFAGNIIVSSGGSITLGFIFRFAIYIVPFILVILLLSISGSSGFLDFRMSNIRLIHIVISVIAALLMYPIVIYFINMPHSLAFFISLIVLAGFFMALYHVINGKVFHGIIIYILTMPFITFLCCELRYKHEMFKIGVFSFHPTEVFMFSLFLIWFVSRLFKREPLIKQPVLTIFILFVCWGVVSIMFSIDIAKSLFTWISGFFYPMLFFILLINNIKTEKEIRILLYSLIFLAGATTFFEFYFTLGAQKEFNIEMIHATQLYWVGRGALLLLVIPLNICLLGVVSKKMQIPVFLSTIFLLILIILDNTRVIIVAFIVSLAVFINRKKYIITFIILALIMLIFWDQGAGLIFERFKEIEFTVQGLSLRTWSPMRYEGITASFEMIKQYPLFGIGVGMWDEHFYKYGSPIIYYISGLRTPIYIRSPHNGYLNYAVHMGLPALILWLSFLFLAFKTTIKIIKNSKLTSRRNFALGSLGSLLALCTGSFGGTFQFSIHGNLSLGILILGIISIPIALDRLEKSSPT